jgi:hypothetical protein
MLYEEMRLHTVCFVLLLLVCRISAAQVASARLEGLVRDSSGAVVPGAAISVVNTRNQARAETLTTSDGLFVFPSLQPGLYTLGVEAAGFHKTVVSNLELNVGATVLQNVKLEVGAIPELVEVQAGQERVQTSDAQLTRAVTLRDIESLPLMGRSPMGLAIYSTGVQTDPNNASISRVNGTRNGSANSRLDGIDANDPVTPRLLLAGPALNIDSIEEFRVVTNGGKAEYGRNAGAQIELITRTGTNTWHGNLFEYHRNTVLNANEFFNNSSGSPRPVNIQNTFGASLGGPIHRDSSFIFGNYQGRRTARQIVRNRTVLTPEAKKGLFRWKSPGSTVIQTYDIVHNDLRGLGIDPKVAENLKLLPEPNNYENSDGLNTGNFRFNNPAMYSLEDTRQDQFILRADHKIRSRHSLIFRWAQSRSLYIDSVNNNDARFPGQPSGTHGGSAWGYSTGWDWAISPRFFNELRLGYKTYAWDFIRPARLEEPMLLSNSWTDPLNPAFSSYRKPAAHQFTDNFTVVEGKHMFKAGIEGRFTKEWTSDEKGIWPNVSFESGNGNNPPSDVGPHGDDVISKTDRQSFEKLYNDLLGRMGSVIQTFYSDLKAFYPAGTPRERTFQYRDFGVFFQDDWKLTPHLTVNLGLRYEFFGVPSETNGIQGTMDKAELINATAQLADLAVLPGNRLYNSDFNNFAPRIGIAWDPAGDGKTAIRANWGLFYDRLIGATTSYVDANTPGFSLPNLPVYPNQAGTDFRVSDGIPLPHPDGNPVLQPPATRSTNLWMFSPDLRAGYVQHYSLTFQREIFRNTVVEAGYVGTHGVKLFMDLNLNQPRIYDDFLAAFLELQAFRNNGTPVSDSNTLVSIFGTETAAIKAIGPTTIDRGEAGTGADSVDRFYYSKYSQAGVTDFYLRNFPQFDKVIVGTNDGRSYYNSFQLRLRRQSGALKFVANYTFSKTMDNISTEGNGFTSPIDNFNVRLNLARSDYDVPHTFNSSCVYTLPVGEGRPYASSLPRWLDSIIGGWDVGLLTLWQSGRVVSYVSGRYTGPTPATPGRGTAPALDSSFMNYAGDRNIGQVMRRSDGVFWLTEEEIAKFSYPLAGEIGTGGRNAFRGPRYFSVDLSLVKRFRITERHGVLFRAEAYNLFNNSNFAPPNSDFSKGAFGRISSTVGNPRMLQMALRYDF